MYERIPPKTNQKSGILALLLLIGAVALIAVCGVFPNLPFRWVGQLLALCMGAAAVLLVVRYWTRSYLYRIIATENGSADLTVTELKGNGKRRMVVCRVGLSRVRDRMLEDAAHRAQAEQWLSAHKKEGVRVFDYRPDLLPDQSILLLVEEGGERQILRLAYDPVLYDLLTPNGEMGES